LSTSLLHLLQLNIHQVITYNNYHQIIMSTDLQFLPLINSSSLQINLPLSTSDESYTIQLIEQQQCQTPRSPSHTIPEITVCPPAPKKQRRSAPSCKRRLSEFEIVARDEIESFFKSSYEFIDQIRPRT